MNPLERQRLASGLKQSDVADRLGVATRTVSKWENGETQPRPEHYPKLAEVFGITPLEVTRLIVPDDAHAGQADSAAKPQDAA